MNHVENPLIWQLFFLVAGLSSVAAFTAVIGREAIWRPRDSFDKAFQWAFRGLGASAFVSLLVFCYSVTERCVVAENECERFKNIAAARANYADGIAFESGRDQDSDRGREYTTTTAHGRTVSIRSSRPMPARTERDWRPSGRTRDVPGFVGTTILRR